MTSAVVFDFDCTITYTHLFHLFNSTKRFEEKWGAALIDSAVSIEDLTRTLNGDWHKSEQELVEIFFGGKRRLASLNFFFRQLKGSGHDLYVSSKGNFQQIRNVLAFGKLGEYVTGINATGVPNPQLRGSKHQFISSLAGRHGYRHVFYIDDDPDEHRIIIEQKLIPLERYSYFGDNVGLSREGNGLSAKMMAAILFRAKESLVD
jgi:hypothetical protein